VFEKNLLKGYYHLNKGHEWISDPSKTIEELRTQLAAMREEVGENHPSYVWDNDANMAYWDGRKDGTDKVSKVMQKSAARARKEVREYLNVIQGR
jgi:hypothetical protein